MAGSKNNSCLFLPQMLEVSSLISAHMNFNQFI